MTPAVVFFWHLAAAEGLRHLLRQGRPQKALLILQECRRGLPFVDVSCTWQTSEAYTPSRRALLTFSQFFLLQELAFLFCFIFVKGKMMLSFRRHSLQSFLLCSWQRTDGVCNSLCFAFARSSDTRPHRKIQLSEKPLKKTRMLDSLDVRQHEVGSWASTALPCTAPRALTAASAQNARKRALPRHTS